MEIPRDHIRLIGSLAKKYRKFARFLDYDDLFQEGCLGYLHALKKYNPKKGSFNTYAYWWVRQYITRALKKVDNRLTYSIESANYGKDEDIQIIDVYALGNAENDAMKRLRSWEIQKAISKLPKKQQHIVYEHYFNDKTMTKIGQEMSVTKQTVSTQHKLAIQNLKKIIGSYEVWEGEIG